MKKMYKLLLLLLILDFEIETSKAQELSTLGKTFWLTFMENNASNTDSATPPEMKIVISCPKATSGTVKNVNTGHSLPFSIGSGGGVDTVYVPGYMGYCINSESKSRRMRGLVVQANDTVAVSAQSTKSFTCDASLIYPIEALGVDYRILSYLGDPTGPNTNYRSAFAIVATENNTSIEITPSVLTKGGNAANTKFTIVLNKGESYQVQASTNKLDLSGTLVQALNCKKIAVFGGSSRSAIGPPGNSCASSYDHLYEQMMPINLWGKKFIIAPTVWSKGKLRKWELIKVVSNTNNTIVRFNNRPVKIINAGASDTFWIDSSRCKNTLITSNKAVGVCQYASSEACDGGGFFGTGTDTDPMMMWVSPIEQSLKSLNFSCENALTINKFFLNVYVKTAYRSSFRLDGATPTVPWQLVNNDTSYSYVQQSGLTQGKHNITSPYGFSAILYAYGDHGSYGYNAGSSVKPLSFYMTAAGKSSADFELDTPYYVACQGTSIPFDIATSYTPTGYKWILYNPSGNTIKTTKAFNYTFTDTGMIKVMAVTTRPLVGICNGISTDTLFNYVKVFPKPKIRLLADTTICRGNSFYITSKTDGDTNYTFTPSTWLSCNKCFKPKCTPLMDTSYTVVAVTKGCNASRDTFKVKIRDSIFLSKSNDTTICRGTTTTISGTAKGGYVAGQTITWDHGLGTGFSKVVAPKVTTTYRLILTDGCTRDGNGNFYADTNFIKVTVYDSLKITMPRDTSICEGNSVTLTAKKVGGRPGTSILKWDNGLDTGNNKTITIGSVSKTYKAVLSDGCTVPKDSGYVKITVRPGLKIDTILYQTPVCRNTPFKVRLKLSGGDSTGYRVRLLNSTYSSPGQVIDSFKNTAYPYFNLQIPDDSKFKIAFDQACNSNTAPLKPFNVAIKNTLNIVSTKPIDSVCKGQNYDIKATGSNSDNISIKFILKKKNGASYTPVDSMIHLSNASFTLTPPIIPADYIIIGNDGCNRNDTDKFRVAIKNTLNIVSTLAVDTVCTGQSYDIKATGRNSDNIPIKFILKKKNGASFTPVDSMTNLSNATFKVTPTITQTDYIIIGNDGCNLNDTDKFKLMMRAPMSFKTFLSPTDLCRNESYTFTTSVNDGKSQSRTYTWTDGRNGTLLGSGTSVTVKPSASMVVAVTADDGCSSPIKDSTTLYVAPVVSDSTLAIDTAGCQTYPTAFKFPLTVAQSINTKFDWKWYFDGNNAPFSTTPSSGGQTHADIPKTYTAAGIYSGKVEMVLSNGKICYSYNQIINVWKQANAEFSYSPIQIDIIEPLVTFTNQSIGATNYVWDFGDNSALDNQDNPTHSYSDTGTYLVKLTATNAKGCNDNVEHHLTVLDIFRIWIPTAFSPNLDEFNSYWAPNVTSMQKMEFEIFNRWGEEVFKSDGSLKWTGQYTNKPDVPCPEGIYYYHIKVRDNRKHWHYYSGTLTLLR